MGFKLKILSLVSKIIGHRQMYIEKGKIMLWNVPLTFMEIETMPIMIQELKKEKKIQNILYYAGKIQAENGTNMLIQKFGLKEKSDYDTFVGMFLDQAVMIGVAKLDLEQAGDALEFTYTGTSNIALQYKAKYGLQDEAIDHHLRGLLAGASEALFGKEKELVAIETECIAKGDQKCKIVVKEIDKWDLTDKRIKEQMPEKIIDFDKLKKQDSLLTWLKS